MIQCSHSYEHIISLENLLEAWKEFLNGKRNRKDVQFFERDLMHNIISLHHDLRLKQYKHSSYEAFNISDPKPRNIHKASVRDRLLHHALYRILYPFFDRIFIADSYSCRFEKGTHRAINKFRQFAFVESQNHTKTLWVLKCDIRKFFASIDHQMLKAVIVKHIPDQQIVRLLEIIIDSFYSTHEGVGLPLGNLTSQLLVNVYMNEFDQFVKRELKIKYYIRYADDFVILSRNKVEITNVLGQIQKFLEMELRLKLHPNKVFIKTFASGVDFLGWTHFSDHRVLRTATKKRVIKKLKESYSKTMLVSYKGMLKHGNVYKIEKIYGLKDLLR